MIFKFGSVKTAGLGIDPSGFLFSIAQSPPLFFQLTPWGLEYLEG